jgi:hypothetical protein
MLLPLFKNLPSYPSRVICRFCFENSQEVNNRKCWDFWKKSDCSKAIAANDEVKMEI